MAVGKTPPPKDGQNWDGYADIESSTSSQEARQSYQQSVEASFKSRRLTSISKDQVASQIPETEAKPQHKPINKFALTRVLGRAMSRGLLPDKVFVTKQNFEWPAPKTELNSAERLDSIDIDIDMSDLELVADLRYSEGVSKHSEQASLFESQEPSPEDIRQNDKRKSCYLLSSLASMAATNNGKQQIKANICQLGPDHAAVRLFDRVTDKNIVIRVSTARLLDKDKRDLYSFGNRSGAIWPGVMEKAFHALKIHRVKTLRVMLERAKSNDEKDLIRSQLNELEVRSGEGNLLDKTELLGAIYAIPCLPKKDSSNAAYTQSLNAPIMLLNPAEQLHILRFNIEQGVPAIAGIGQNFRGASRAVLKGTPPSHAVAILGPAQRKLLRGGEEDGVLIYDPFGDSLNGKGQVVHFSSMHLSEEKEDDKKMVSLAKGGQALSFVSYKDFPARFSKVAIARGGYTTTARVEDSSFMSIEPDEFAQFAELNEPADPDDTQN